MGKGGYGFMIAGAVLVALPFYFAWQILLTSGVTPLMIQVFPHEPGLIDLSALWNSLLEFIILYIMIKSGAVLLQYGAESTKARE
jgi:hypothetical protein